MTLPGIGLLKRRPRVLNVLHALQLVRPFSETNEMELACLERYARGRKVAVEIGTAMGVSAVRIAKALAPGATLYCVDPYEDGSAMWAMCKRVLRRHDVLDRIVFLPGCSDVMAHQIPLECDFFFVDADHTYQGLRTDWQIVLDHLAAGGIASFHDTTVPPQEPARTHGSVQFFEDVIRGHPEFKHLETCYSLNVIQRVGPV